MSFIYLSDWKWKLNSFKASLPHILKRNILDFGRRNSFASPIYEELRHSHEVLTPFNSIVGFITSCLPHPLVKSRLVGCKILGTRISHSWKIAAQSWGFDNINLQISIYHLLVATSSCKISSRRTQSLQGSFLLFCHSAHKAFWEWRNCSFGTWDVSHK